MVDRPGTDATDDELRARKAELEAIFRALPDLLFELGPDGRIASYRAGRTEDLYAAPADFLGKRMRDVLPPGPADAIDAGVARVVGGERLARVEYELPMPDGARHFEARLVPLDGGGIVAVVRDVTEQHRAAEERRALDRKLEEAQRLESLGVLAGGIAHDFNNLLGAIVAATELLERHARDAPELRVPLDIVRDSAWRASELSRQLLAYAGRGRMVTQPFDLGALVGDTTHLLQAAVSKKARLDLDLPRDLPAVEGDPAQLRQVLMNLLTNASDAIGERGGTVRLRTRLRERAPELPGSPLVELEVVDDGSGIDEVTRQRMFEPFYSTKGPGRGLGLASVVGIVRAHHGRIDVESTPGRGTTVRVLLPASARPAQDLAPTTSTPISALEGGVVLVVDDERGMRVGTAAILEHAGLGVHTAEDGRQALEALARLPEIELVVLDMTMPVLCGDGVLEAMHQTHPGLPVILMSGHHAPELRPGAARPYAWLMKPFSAAALLAAVRGGLASRKCPDPIEPAAADGIRTPARQG